MAEETSKVVHDGDAPDLSAGFRPHGSVHPAGKVTAFDEATGLPIVRRAATEPSGQPSGGERPAIQASDDPEELRDSASDQKPIIADMAKIAVHGVPGAKVEGMRVKETDAVENKDDRGKPPETIADHLGARVSAKTDAGVEAVKDNIASKLPVQSKDKIDSNGLKADQYAVQTGKPGEPNQQSEIQVVTADQAKAMKDTDDLYDKQKKALATGDKAEADRIGKIIKARFDDVETKQTLAKGDRVQLPDGRFGTVKFYDASGTKNARVTADDGRAVWSIPAEKLKLVPEATQGPKSPQRPPTGATHIAPGSDGKMHFTDLKRDLGVAHA